MPPFLDLQRPVVPTPPQNQVCDNQSGANAQLIATLAAASGLTTYLTGFTISGLGATAAGAITVVIAGLLGGSISITLPVVAGVAVAQTPYSRDFPTPLAGAAPNTAITITVPAFGAGNTSAKVEAHGFQL